MATDSVSPDKYMIWVGSGYGTVIAHSKSDPTRSVSDRMVYYSHSLTSSPTVIWQENTRDVNDKFETNQQVRFNDVAHRGQDMECGGLSGSGMSFPGCIWQLTFKMGR